MQIASLLTMLNEYYTQLTIADMRWRRDAASALLPQTAKLEWAAKLPARR